MSRLRRQILLLAAALGAALLVVAFLQFRGMDWIWAKTYAAQAGRHVRAIEGGGEFALLPVATGLQQPTAVAFVPGGGGRAVALEKGGTARLLELSESAKDTPRVAQPSSLVLRLDVRTNSEMGLLGIAFHPEYAKNGRFFINANPREGSPQTVVSEWHLALSDLGKKQARFVRKILNVDQPFSNHDGGHLLFGPDGFLYIGLGDGGSGGDPKENGQNLGTLLGAILRIDVNDSARGDALPYGIPQDNPFVGRPGARAEIWAYGLRNPWRFSFAPAGHLIVGDVGQSRFEEIDVVARGDNMGWNVREAAHCFRPERGCTTKGLVDPIFEYGRDLGTSVTGGETYTGKRIPALAGRYVFGDFTYGNLWALKISPDGRRTEAARYLGRWPGNVSSFARSPEGELLLVQFDTGTIFRLDLAP